MGKVTEGILGGFIGKVGTVVGSVRDGKAYMRSKGYRNPKKVTESQQNQRQKFGILKRVIAPLTPAFAIGFRNYCENTKPQHAAFKMLFESDLIGEAPDFEVDYSKLVVSKGTLVGFPGLKVTSTNRTITATWVDDSGVDKLDANDLPYMVVVLNEIDMVYFVGGDVIRADGAISYTVHELLPTNKAHVYLFMASVSSSKVSKTFHFEVEL